MADGATLSFAIEACQQTITEGLIFQSKADTRKRRNSFVDFEAAYNSRRLPVGERHYLHPSPKNTHFFRQA